MDKLVTYCVEINGLHINAVYSQDNINNIFLPLLKDLTELQKKKGKRILVLLAAPPGAGKSTLSSFLEYQSTIHKNITRLTAIGMDGFHKRQSYLLSHTILRDGHEIPMVKIKGSPETFDLEHLLDSIRRLASGEDCGWPSYNRLLHDPEENKIFVTGSIVLLEGNYLLLDQPMWKEISTFSDYTIKIVASQDQLRQRLIDRKISSGTSEQDAEEFVEFSDLANVRLCLRHSLPATLTLALQSDSTYAKIEV